MAYLLDTGILLRAFDPASGDYEQVLRSLDLLWQRGETLFVTVQNLAEFWNVATRPIANNGLGLNAVEVAKQLQAIEDFAIVLTESAQSFAVWKRLVIEQSVVGAKVHDARLASVMLVAGIANILTFNERDFRRLAGLSPISPANVTPS